MKKIIVINSLPSDEFSNHLFELDHPDFEIERMRFLDDKFSEEPSIILLVNEKLSLAPVIKERFRNSKVAVVSGGKKTFQANLILVYGHDNYDDYTFSSWAEVDHLLFDNISRKDKVIVFKNRFTNGAIYSPNLSMLSGEGLGPKDGFESFFQNSTLISFVYLEWQKKWLEEANKVIIPINVKPKKTLRRLKVQLDNKCIGLPLLSVGDRVILLDYCHNIIDFSHPDQKNQKMTVSVETSKANEVVIHFSLPLNVRHLKQVFYMKLDTSISMRKIKRMIADLSFIQNNLELTIENSSRPVNFICSANFRSNNLVINYPSEIFVPDSLRKIMADDSQLYALMDMLSDKVISIIKGPAGTGKTFVAALVVLNFFMRGAKVFIVSKTNRGLDNLLIAIAKYVDNERIYRIGNDLSVMEPEVRRLNREIKQITSDPNYFDNIDTSGRKFGSVYASTIDYFLMNPDLVGELPDLFICDEASCGFIFDFAPLFIAAKHKIILIGDDEQLGNMPIVLPLLNHLKEALVFRDEAEGEESIRLFEDGFFNALVGKEYLESIMLLINRRSLPHICKLVSEVFYQGKVISGRFNPHNQGKVIFLDTKNLKVTEKKEGRSRYNPLEVSHLVKRLIALAVKNVQAGGEINEVVAITSYVAQVKSLRKKLRKHLLYNDALKKFVNPNNIEDVLEVLVMSVNKMQGGQRKNVFASLVCSNEEFNIGFNNLPNRWCVMMTRTEELLIIIGDSETFLNCGHDKIEEIFKTIIDFVGKDHKHIMLRP